MSDRQTEHNGLPVAGYRPQSMAAVDLVNENKRIEEELLRVLDTLEARPDTDRRWLAIGRTGVEQSFMAINRSIFKPSRVKLVNDQG